MKKGICIGSVPGDLEEKFRLAKAAGFDGVEINTVDTDEESEKLKELADKNGLEIPSIMNSAHWQFPMSDPDSEVRAKSVDGMMKSLSSASIVGADTVLLVPGVVNENVCYEDAYETSQKEIKNLARDAEDREVFIAIENVWNKFLLSPIEFANYVDEIDSDYVAAYFDVGNILLYGYPQHWIRTLGSRIKKVHVKGFKVGPKSFTYLLDSDINWAEVMKAFHDINYDGYITAEMPPYTSFPEQMVYDTSEHMDKIFNL
ncbi:TIM barrel protein [Candidatus Poribacteria bacterium]|nr:TIM barrel protein [Candidatus Poribacteria bacterium]